MSQTVDLGQFFDNLERTHIVYFHDGGEGSKNTEFNFIKKGIDKKQHCFYTTQKPEEILNQMKEFGIDTEANSEFLHVIEIPEKFEDYSKMILDKVAELPQDSEVRVISTHYFDFNSEEKTDRMAEIEQCVDDDFHKINGNFVCSFAVNKITNDIRNRFLNQLLDSHKAIVFQTEKTGTEVFTLP
uniref:MEDS domain-containing protein n=2 Tax=environmental samples TaxID=651140 RepID=A0A075HFP7_9ARCH|nr:hypothetical protein [uncultured marine thaumarchaeote KM3_01_G08]AIF13267.1 hypothetical protein [uncultured marine thaumarchaeote KM3_61_F01]